MHSGTTLALALVAGLACSAAAQDGGKVAWRGKTDADLKKALEEAKKDGKAVMFFFTSEG